MTEGDRKFSGTRSLEASRIADRDGKLSHLAGVPKLERPSSPWWRANRPMATDDQIPEREQRVRRMLQQAAQTERAPANLRAEVGALGTEAAARRTRRPIFGVPARYASGVFVGLVAVVVALATTLGGGGVGGPTLAQAAALAIRGAVLAAPAPDPNAPSKLLAVRVGDLQFPNWQSHGGWRSSGARTDTISNRQVKTVYYSGNGRQIAYSIVAAPALAGVKTGHDGYATLSRNGRTVIVWEKDDHTCILSAIGVSASRLWKLAASAGAGSS